MSTSTKLLLPLLMGLKELTDADKVSPLAAEYRPPFIVPKRLLLACICIEKIVIAKSSNDQKSFQKKNADR